MYACSCTTDRTTDASCFITTSPTEDGVLAHVRAGLDEAVGADDRGTVDARLGVDLGPLAEPDVLAEAEAVDLDVDLAVEDVLVGAQVRLEVPDVLPVALGDVSVAAACPASAPRGTRRRRSRRPRPRG